MKLCQRHWTELKEAITQRGLFHLVSKDGKIATERVVSELQSGSTEENYDPLMSATMMIYTNALKCFGLELMMDDAPCPLCLLDKHAEECTEENCARSSGHDWIRFAADGQLQYAQEKGIIKHTTN